MKIVAYLRISTGGQELSNQRLAILDYAQHHQLQIDRFLEIQVSSRKSLKERGIDGLFAGMQAGDLLLVSELSRLGRSVGQVIQIVDDLIKHQIKFIAIKRKYSLGRKTRYTKADYLTMFRLFAEIERDLISERTCEGLAAARAKGRMLGRPKGFRWNISLRW